jgi:hypothetical protein
LQRLVIFHSKHFIEQPAPAPKNQLSLRPREPSLTARERQSVGHHLFDGEFTISGLSKAEQDLSTRSFALTPIKGTTNKSNRGDLVNNGLAFIQRQVLD